jgi:CHAT domain-containing protein
MKNNEEYLKAYDLLESLRSYFHAEDIRISFIKDKLAVYESLVRLCLSRGSPSDHRAAFVYIDRAKSRALADVIAIRARQTSSTEGADHSLGSRVRSLREELNWFNRQIQIMEEQSVPHEDPRWEKLRSDARICEQQLLQAFTRLRTEDPEVAELHSAASEDVDQIRSALAPDAVLLQYYAVRGILHVCMLSHQDLKVVALGPVNKLESVLRLLRFQFSKFRLGMDNLRGVYTQLMTATNFHLEECYRLLLAPFEAGLRAGHLVIAPHGLLHSLPFHALFDGRQYLGSRVSISYTPSASVYYLCCAKDRVASDCALVLGIPDPAAPHIREEVDAVASVLQGAEVYVGAAASREIFRTRAARSRLVHIATHGKFRQDSPMFSSIALGDSQVNLMDLYELRLQAELVTLSGCGTGLNVVVGGDELLGLIRGLLYAGAHGALGTLWDVNDNTAAQFMKCFYEQLRSGGNKAIAVQRAMAEVREEYPHPFHWAPFVLVGQYR